MSESNATRPTNEEPHRGGEAGFTLVEILIAMLVLAIGILGALTMQYAALNGAVASQDLTNATDIGQRIKHVLGTEAQKWRQEDIETALSGTSAYDADWAVDSLLLASAKSTDQWVQVFEHPVDVRMSTHGNQRYCAYVRGKYLENRRGTGGHRERTMFRVHIAVVYPSGSQSFDEECPGTGGDPISGMDPGRSPEDSDSLERQGYRAVHLATIITQRGHLHQR
ncbi:MAG: type IV pilus modification PilV family protein [Persicimonas sp.]